MGALSLIAISADQFDRIAETSKHCAIAIASAAGFVARNRDTHTVGNKLTHSAEFNGH